MTTIQDIIEHNNPEISSETKKENNARSRAETINANIRKMKSGKD
jgi:hypothetical protein